MRPEVALEHVHALCNLGPHGPHTFKVLRAAKQFQELGGRGEDFVELQESLFLDVHCLTLVWVYGLKVAEPDADCGCDADDCFRRHRVRVYGGRFSSELTLQRSRNFWVGVQTGWAQKNSTP